MAQNIRLIHKFSVTIKGEGLFLYMNAWDRRENG
jgi:hypothetical protein